MIKNFSDHAANERTFLAWVRTAIAVMAFGFLVESSISSCGSPRRHSQAVTLPPPADCSATSRDFPLS